LPNLSSMATTGFMKAFAILSSFFLISLFIFFKPNILQTKYPLLVSNTYFGPTEPEDKKLIFVEVIIRDSSNPTGPQIVSVAFDQKNIPLKPRDIYGNRGSGSFKLSPGKYKLKWVTNQSKITWPRKVKHVEEVTINSRDLWVQIQIEGENASIS
jgi:hypothetical protein